MDDVVPDGSVRPDRFSDVDLEVFAGFRAYYKGFSVDARSGEAVISFAVPVKDKYEALRITDRPGLVGFVQFWAKRQK